MAPGLIDPEMVEKEKASLGPLFAQEYECAFLSIQNAAIPQDLIERSLEEYEVEEF